MTPDQLLTICDKHGSQTAVARAIGRNVAYINRMIHGKDKITDSVVRRLRIAFPAEF